MSLPPLLTLAPFAALAAGFVLWGHRPRRLAALAAVLLVGWAAGGRALGHPGPSPLLAAALLLWAAGLALAAAMLRRSASLGALRRLAAGEEAIPVMREEMALRVDELVQLGWARRDDDRLEATPRGRRIGAAARTARRLFGAGA